MTNAPIDITPEDSVVPVYLASLPPEEDAELKLLAKEAEQRVKDEGTKAAAKESAKAKLAALGLTEEEVAALLN